MFIITIRDVAELLAWICLILFLIWLAKPANDEKKEQEQDKQSETINDKNESEDKNND